MDERSNQQALSCCARQSYGFAVTDFSAFGGGAFGSQGHMAAGAWCVVCNSCGSVSRTYEL
jgi:hypothetical protein